MCPICITTMVVNGLLSLGGILGLTGLVNYIKKRYYFWTGKKCKKCRDRECKSNTHD